MPTSTHTHTHTHANLLVTKAAANTPDTWGSSFLYLDWLACTSIEARSRKCPRGTSLPKGNHSSVHFYRGSTSQMPTRDEPPKSTSIITKSLLSRLDLANAHEVRAFRSWLDLANAHEGRATHTQSSRRRLIQSIQFIESSFNHHALTSIVARPRIEPRGASHPSRKTC